MRELLIYDEITDPFTAEFFGVGISASMVAAVLKEFDGEDVLVRINSPGGNANEGIAIYDALMAYSGKVATRVEGAAMSAATIVSQGGERREISNTARMFIHQGRAGGGMMTAGEHRMTAEGLDTLDSTITELYAAGKKGAPTQAQFAEWIDPGKWFSATDAVKAGLASHVVEAGAGLPAMFNCERHAWVRDVPDDLKQAAVGRMPWHGNQEKCQAVMCGKFGTPTDPEFSFEKPAPQRQDTLAKMLENRAKQRQEQAEMQASLDEVLYSR